MKSWRPENSTAGSLKVKAGKREEVFFFLPGEKFHSVERAFFLGVLFRFPIPRGIISSYFGSRKSPITGGHSFHNGIDIAAPHGTDVLASREGIVTRTATDPVYGKYIVIKHDNDYETLYGHLSESFVELHQRVNSGMIIAKVGSTGLSTGPHLHFEIFRDGQSRDPVLLLHGEHR